MMKALKRYYAEMTTAKMLNMEDAPPEVLRWREMNDAKNATLQMEMLTESGQSPIREGVEAKVKALTEALGGAQ